MGMPTATGLIIAEVKRCCWEDGQECPEVPEQTEMIPLKMVQYQKRNTTVSCEEDRGGLACAFRLGWLGEVHVASVSPKPCLLVALQIVDVRYVHRRAPV